jgi:hypothetical protein
MGGEDAGGKRRRTWIDWTVVTIATVIIVGFALTAQSPQIAVRSGWIVALVTATLAMLVVAATALWRTTRFN